MSLSDDYCPWCQSEQATPADCPACKGTGVIEDAARWMLWWQTDHSLRRLSPTTPIRIPYRVARNVLKHYKVEGFQVEGTKRSAGIWEITLQPRS